MTPKEKAIKLVEDYRILFLSFGDYVSIGKCQRCALIAVDEILNVDPSKKGMIIGGTQTRYLTTDYWEKVKQEIEKL